MMPQRMPFLHAFPSHSYTLSLDGVHYEVTLTYRARTASWYLDLRDEDGVLLVAGRRLSPNWSPVSFVITNGPPGALVVFGADPYDRYEIELWYYSADEVAAAAPGLGTLLPVALVTS